MSFSLIANSTGDCGINVAATPGINSTGADFLVLAYAWLSASGTPTLADTKANTYTALTSILGSTGRVNIAYVANPIVGSVHSANATLVSGYNGAALMAWSGSKLTTPADQQNGAGSASATTQQPGSVTPSENDELLVVGVGAGNVTSDALSIDGGFTETADFTDGTSFKIGMDYLVQTTLAAANPTVTRAAAGPIAVKIATFKCASPTPPGGRLVKMAGPWGGFAGSSGGFAA